MTKFSTSPRPLIGRDRAVPRSLDELRTTLRSAHRDGAVVLPRGAGSKSTWLELPPVVDVLLDMQAFDGIDYDPGTGQVTVGAGVPVAVVQDTLARLGRRLPLDPPSPQATIGGVLATGECGPLAHGLGPPAAHLADATVVLPDGTVTTVAERTETLGSSVCDLRWAYPGCPHPASAIAQATLHTVPAPAARAWLTCPVAQPMHADELSDAVLAAHLSPAAIELDLPGIRRDRTLMAGVPARRPRRATGTLAVLLEGATVDIADRAQELSDRLGAQAHLTEQAPSWWGRYPFRSTDIGLQLYTGDGQLYPICYALADAAGALVPVRGSTGVGPAWAAIPADVEQSQLVGILNAARNVLMARGGAAVVRSAPHGLRELVAPYRSL